jgi:hypothetical protein
MSPDPQPQLPVGPGPPSGTFNTAVVQRVVAYCVQQAYRPLQTSLTQTESNAWLTDPNLQGALLAGTNANPFDTSSPASSRHSPPPQARASSRR